MRSTVAVITTLLTILIVSSTIVDEDDAFFRDFNDQVASDSPRRQGLAAALEKYVACREWRWSCQKPCRAQIPVKSNDSVTHCMAPLPGETCFGVPIDYKYVPSREPLPVEYEVLKRFPKCWSVLGPMLCGMIYRPCGVYEFTAKLSSAMFQMELWQRFGIGMCRRVHEQCEDAIKEGFFPSELIDCKRTAENITWIKEKTNAVGSLARYVPSGSEEELQTEWDRQTVFTEESCNVKYNENASRHEPMQCIFPLVYTMHEKIQPVIDKCFLPCRNPLISSPEKFISFQVMRALLCFAFAFIFMGIFLYLSSYSIIFLTSDCIFSIACAFLSFSVYLLLWGLGAFSFFAEASECTRTVHGVPIRSSPLFESTWCSITAVLQHSFLLSSIGFISAAYALNAASATRAEKEENRKKSYKTSGFRVYLAVGIVVVSGGIGFLALFLKMVTTDGVAGLCTAGLHSIIGHSTVVALPGLAYCLIGLAIGLHATWKEKKRHESTIAYSIAEKIREVIEHEKAKEKVEFWTDRGPNQKEELQEAFRALPPVEERTEGGETTEGEKSGEEEKETLVLRGDEDSKEWISEVQKREMSDTIRKEMSEDWRGKEKKEWHASIPTRYTLVALCLCMGSLIFGLSVHYVTLANDGNAELDAVRAYVTCVLSKSIIRKDLHWMSEPVHANELWLDGRGESDPLVRRHNLASEITIHSCTYPSTGDGRMFGLLAVFVLLPLLPLIVLIWAFGAGFAGFGGMKNVRQARPRVTRLSDEDVEMTALTTERDDESQLMSSVASTISDAEDNDIEGRDCRRVRQNRLTDLSEASEDDSAHSMVSDRQVITVRPNVPMLSEEPIAQLSTPERTSNPDHHRILDVMGRGRRERKMKKSKRTSSDVQNARREGVAESGHLLPPRDRTVADADLRSVSSHTTNQTSSTVSSCLQPPSEVGRRMIANAQLLMARARAMERSHDAGLQERLQMVQEELMLRSLPTEDDSQPSDNEDGMYWERNLEAAKEEMQRYVADVQFVDLAQAGITLAAYARLLAQNSRRRGTSNHLSNYMFLQHSVEQLQTVALHLQQRLVAPESLLSEVASSTLVLQIQLQVNAMPNPIEALDEQLTQNIDVDVHSAEAMSIRMEAYAPGVSAERQEELFQEMVRGMNRRIILRIADQQQLLRRSQQQQQMIQQLMNGVGRPPAYARASIVPMPVQQDGDDRSEWSYSVTNSTVPSSSLSIAEQDSVLRAYHDTQHRPPEYEAPSRPGPIARAGEAAIARATGAPRRPPPSNPDTAGFWNEIMRNNGLAFAEQTGHFEAPTGTTNSSPGYAESMSSMNSLDTIERQRMVPVTGTRGPRGQFQVPIFRAVPTEEEQARAANLAAANPGPTLAHFPFAQHNVTVPSFPGAQSSRRLHASPMEQREQLSGAVRAFYNAAAVTEGLQRVRIEDTPAPAPAAPRTPRVMGLADLPEAPDHPIQRVTAKAVRYADKKKRKAAPLEAESTCSSSRRKSQDDDNPPPMIGRVRVVADSGRASAIAAPLVNLGQAGSSGMKKEEDTDTSDSGVESIESSRNAANQRRQFLPFAGDGRTAKLTKEEEMKEFGRKMQAKMEEEDAKRKEEQEKEKKKKEEEEEEEGMDIGDGSGGESDDDDDDDDDSDDDDNDGGDNPNRQQLPSTTNDMSANDQEEARRARMALRDRYLNHSDPDLAMADEERDRIERERRNREREEEEEKENEDRENMHREREERIKEEIKVAMEKMDRDKKEGEEKRRKEEEEERERREEREVEERRYIELARERVQELMAEREAEANEEPDDDSIGSRLSPEEQASLVQALRAALDNRSTEGLDEDSQRLIRHLRLALDTHGGISREEIMRFRVMEASRENRERQNPDRNSPYRVSTVVVSRMSLAEIGARVDSIRSLSSATLYPLEIYYQLHLADVLWSMADRTVMMGDNVYTNDEINRILGSASPLVPEGANGEDFHQLMRKRAITAATLTGRSYGQRRAREGPRYEPPRLPDMGMYELFGDPTVFIAAIHGDLDPIRQAIQRIPLTMPDVMRLDNRTENTLGAHLRHFRDYLDSRARAAGFELREDTYMADDVPPEPTGSRNDGPATKKGPSGHNPGPGEDPAF